MNDQPYDPKRLYRSDDSIVCGVCGGIAEYFDLPPFGVRLIWGLVVFNDGQPAAHAPDLHHYGHRAQAPPPPVCPPFPAIPFSVSGRLSHTEMLGRLQQRFEALDKRLQRMESVVTRPRFRPGGKIPGSCE